MLCVCKMYFVPCRVRAPAANHKLLSRLKLFSSPLGWLHSQGLILHIMSQHNYRHYTSTPIHPIEQHDQELQSNVSCLQRLYISLPDLADKKTQRAVPRKATTMPIQVSAEKGLRKSKKPADSEMSFCSRMLMPVCM